MRTPTADSLWRSYAAHAALAFRGGPAPDTHARDSSLLVVSGAPHVDLNHAALFADATVEDALEIVALIEAAKVPVLLGCSAGLDERAKEVLANAGFVHARNAERLFWFPETIGVVEHPPFDVRRVESDSDVEAMVEIFVEGHGYAAELVREMYGTALRMDDRARGWLAWDGAEPVSFAIVTANEGTLSLYDVTTPTRHRRRGAGRCVVANALAATAEHAARSGSPITQTFFWSSPAGQPLYETMGFLPADVVDVWTIGASAEDLAAVGV